MVGNKICFRSYYGHYLSASGGTVATTRYISAADVFGIGMKDHQYAFKARN